MLYLILYSFYFSKSCRWWWVLAWKTYCSSQYHRRSEEVSDWKHFVVAWQSQVLRVVHNVHFMQNLSMLNHLQSFQNLPEPAFFLACWAFLSLSDAAAPVDDGMHLFKKEAADSFPLFHPLSYNYHHLSADYIFI